jgi:hypothetical protein
MVDACTLKNFSVVDRMGVLEAYFGGRARWTEAIVREAGRLHGTWSQCPAQPLVRLPARYETRNQDADRRLAVRTTRLAAGRGCRRPGEGVGWGVLPQPSGDPTPSGGAPSSLCETRREQLRIHGHAASRIMLRLATLPVATTYDSVMPTSVCTILGC